MRSPTLARGVAYAAALPLAAGLGPAPALATDDPVPAEQHGEWVPVTAGCESPSRFRVEERRMTLVNGKDSQSWGNIGVTHTYFGPDYEGISFVAMPELDSGEAPFTVFFNADDKPGVTKVEIYTEMQGVLPPQVKAIQARAKKLADRFPALNQAPLRKCETAKR